LAVEISKTLARLHTHGRQAQECQH
jgi:hypothetical protein